MSSLLQFQGISKRFSGGPVLQHVSFEVGVGRTVGLVGENGAGKSTLMNILGGNLSADRGDMLLMGQPYAPKSPAQAAANGIAFVHQELNLFANLSVADNIFLTAFPTSGQMPWIDQTKLRAQTQQLLQEVGFELPPETLVERLSSGERQLVEIAKALSLDARLIILDEPTTSLSLREKEALFGLMERLQGRGISMIYISHALGDVFRVCDDIVVLRDGGVVGAGHKAEFSVEQIITLMVGRSLSQLFPERSGRSGEEIVLEACKLTEPGIVHDISFQLRRGEILGIAGLMGAGRSELARILFGLDPCKSGQLKLLGAPTGTTRQRIDQGLAFLTENRREEGLCLNASIADNIALVSLRQQARTPLRLLDFGRLRKALGDIRQAVRLTPSAHDSQPVRTLSGGNQQKVVLAKWLLAKPDVLILDEPTRGIDVGAKFEIYQLIQELADRGAGVLLISSELEELIGLCERILVMARGEIADQLTRNEIDRERILRSALSGGRKSK